MAVSDFAKKERKSHFFYIRENGFFFSPSKQKLKQSNDACTFSRVLQMKEEERERDRGRGEQHFNRISTTTTFSSAFFVVGENSQAKPGKVA